MPGEPSGRPEVTVVSPLPLLIILPLSRSLTPPQLPGPSGREAPRMGSGIYSRSGAGARSRRRSRTTLPERRIETTPRLENPAGQDGLQIINCPDLKSHPIQPDVRQYPSTGAGAGDYQGKVPGGLGFIRSAPPEHPWSGTAPGQPEHMTRRVPTGPPREYAHLF